MGGAAAWVPQKRMTRRARREAEVQQQEETHVWRQKIQSACEKKNGYRTREDAVHIAKIRRSWGHEPSPLWTYYCHLCEHWHLTKTPHSEPPVA